MSINTFPYNISNNDNIFYNKNNNNITTLESDYHSLSKYEEIEDDFKNTNKYSAVITIDKFDESVFYSDRAYIEEKVKHTIAMEIAKNLIKDNKITFFKRCISYNDSYEIKGCVNVVGRDIRNIVDNKRVFKIRNVTFSDNEIYEALKEKYSYKLI